MVKTLGDAYLDLRQQLRIAGVAGYTLEAKELICFAMEVERDQFERSKGMLVFAQDEGRIAELLTRRLDGEPVQYIIGEWDFYSLPFHITTDTLIPRMDTERLVEAGVEYISARDKGRILDLCCGTGCIGISILKNVEEGITGVFSDIDEAVLRVTRQNILRHKLTARALTVRADARQPYLESGGKFNLIVCNPPYIPTGQLDTLDREVRREPRRALDGGEDGLDFYRAIARHYPAALSRGGALMFEVGLVQSGEVRRILKENGFSQTNVYHDLAGVERVVCGIL